MPRYLIQASYNQGGVSGLLSNPQDRAEAIRPVVEGMGGKLESFDYALGEYDVVAIVELPDNITAAALAMAVGAGGALKEYKTTALVSVSEAMEAMRKAAAAGYRSPGS